jgi:hypothetical protein
MQSIAPHGYCTSLAELVDLVRVHLGIRSVIVYDRPGAARIWQEAEGNATAEVLTSILTAGMDLAEALDRVESWVVLGA